MYFKHLLKRRFYWVLRIFFVILIQVVFVSNTFAQYKGLTKSKPQSILPYRIDIQNIDGKIYNKIYMTPKKLREKFGPRVDLSQYKGYYFQEKSADIQNLLTKLRLDPQIDSTVIVNNTSVRIYLSYENYINKFPDSKTPQNKYPGYYFINVPVPGPYLPIFPNYPNNLPEDIARRTPYSRTFTEPNGNFRTIITMRPTSYPISNGRETNWVAIPPDYPISSEAESIIRNRNINSSNYYGYIAEINNDGYNAYNFIFNSNENYSVVVGAGDDPAVILPADLFQRNAVQFDLSSIPNSATIQNVIFTPSITGGAPENSDVSDVCVYDYQEVWPYINALNINLQNEYTGSGGNYDTRNNNLYNPIWSGSRFYDGGSWIWSSGDGLSDHANFNNSGVSAVQSSLSQGWFSIGIVDKSENDESPDYWEGIVRTPHFDELEISGSNVDPPTAPNAVNASDNTYCDRVHITWNDQSSDESGFKIYRNGSQVGSRSANSQSYDDYAANPGTQYTYCVSAYNGAGESDTDCDSGSRNATPEAPNNVSASNGNYCDHVHITWSDQSDNEAGFKIYRNGTLIGNASSNNSSYDDYPPQAGTEYSYCVSAFNDCGESNQDCDNGYRDEPPNNPTNCSASDGEYQDKIRVTWSTVAGASGYKIYRNGNQIATDNAPPYDDYTVGCYNYLVKAYNDCGNSEASNSDDGSTSGTIYGTIAAQNTTVGIPNVTVTVSLNGNSVGSDVTDGQGYYEVTGLQLGHIYTVDPNLDGHSFNPDPAQNVNLTCSQTSYERDFDDVSSFTVTGALNFQNSNCGASGTTILVNNQDIGVQTDGDGHWSAPVQIGNNCFRAQDNYNWQYVENPICLNVIDNNEAANFIVTTTHSLGLELQSGCGASISGAQFQIWEKDNTWDQSCQTWQASSSDQTVFVQLPSMEYYVNYTYNGYSPQTPQVIDLRSEDQSVTFSYLSPLHIAVDNLPLNSGCTLPVLQRGEQDTISIRAFELVNGEECPVDGVTFSILNLVADNNDWEDFTLGVSETNLDYSFVAGEPNISPDYLKKIEIHVSKPGYEDLDNDVSENWVLVTGDKIIGDYLTTVSPQMLFAVVHDPNGDHSYSYLSNGQTLTDGLEISLESELGAGYDFRAVIPVGGPIAVNIGGLLDLTVGVGISGELKCQTTTTEQFTTSQDESPNVIGNHGDVYVVGALNIRYGSSIRVSLEDNCSVVTSNEISYYPESFASTNILTDYYIENHTIPACPDSECIQAWESILDANIAHDGIITDDEWNDVTPIDTISFSGGGIAYDQSVQSAITRSRTFSGWFEINGEMSAGVGIIGTPTGANINVHASMRIGGVTSQTQTSTTEMSIHLQDDEEDDFFSVGLFKDLSFGTILPILIEGSRSSCPWERNTSYTQFIDTQIISGQIHQDLSTDQVAQWTLRVSNPNTNEYATPYLFTLSKKSTTCNSEININGDPLINGAYAYPNPLDVGSYVDLSVTAQFGPSNLCYCDTFVLGIKPSCENSENTYWLPTTVEMSVCWESDCPVPTIVSASPTTINSMGCADTCSVEFDVNTIDGITQNIQKIILERGVGAGWIPIDSLPNPLPPLNPNWTLHASIFSSMPDGIQEYRVHSVCSIGSDNYSEPFDITIDRTPAQIVVSNPSDDESIDPPNNSNPLWVRYNEDMVDESFIAEIITFGSNESIINCVTTYNADDRQVTIFANQNQQWMDLIPYVPYELCTTGYDINGNQSVDTVGFYINVINSIPVSVCFNPFNSSTLGVPPNSQLNAIATVDLRPSVEYLSSFEFELQWDSDLLAFDSTQGIGPFISNYSYTLLSDGIGMDTLVIGSSINGNNLPYYEAINVAEIMFTTRGNIGQTGELLSNWQELTGLNGFNLISQVVDNSCSYEISEPSLGDVNCDAQIGQYDGGLISEQVAFPNEDNMNCYLCGDVNADGGVSIWDAAQIKIWSMNPNSQYVNQLGIGVNGCGYSMSASGEETPGRQIEDEIEINSSFNRNSAWNGDTCTLSISIGNLSQEMFGYGLRIIWDESGLQFDSLGVSHFIEYANLDSINLGILRISWSDFNSLSQDTLLFNAHFKIISATSDTLLVCPELLDIGPSNLQSDLITTCAYLPVNSSSTKSFPAGLPDTYCLLPNYPNPFNPSTTIRYGISSPSDVLINIYDLSGRLVKEWQIGYQETGWYNLVWDGSTINGNELASGLYFCCLRAGGFHSTQKMVFMK